MAFGLAVGLALLPGGAAAAGSPSPYVGFWEAIDAHDGERTVRSIVPLADGTFRIMAASDYFSTCADADGKGSLTATGVAEDGKLVGSDTRIACADGQVFERLHDEYSYDPATDLLTQTRVGHDRAPFVLHRLSIRAAGTADERAAAPLRFVGFWETIDAEDGGRTVRSIVPLGDDTFRIMAASEHFSTCKASGGEGSLIATGVVEGEKLVAADTRIECVGGEVFDKLHDEYSYDPENDLLAHIRVGSQREPFVLHRLSPPAP